MRGHQFGFTRGRDRGKIEHHVDLDGIVGDELVQVGDDLLRILAGQQPRIDSADALAGMISVLSLPFRTSV